MPENENSVILIVDDTPNVIEPVISILKKKGYRLLVASNGRLAFTAMKKNKPDLILLDVIMPEEDGYSVCGKIKSVKGYEDIPIIFLTAKDDVEDETKGLSMGAVDYIRKPANPAIVQSRIDTHLTLKKAKDEINKANAKLYTISKSLNEKVKTQTRELSKSMNNIIKLLISTMEMRYKALQGHSQRISSLSVELAAAAGLSKEVIDRIKVAALLHDVGVLGSIDLDGNTKGFFKMDARHCEIGRDMVKFVGENFRDVADIILYHHEHLDGSGFLGATENMIPIESRVISIVDTYDTISYGIGKDKNAFVKEYMKDIEIKNTADNDSLAREAAIVHIKKNGFTCYDPMLVKAFLDMMKSKGVSSDYERIMPIEKLKPGMRLARVLQSKGGVILLPFGTTMTNDHIEKLKTISTHSDPAADVYVVMADA